MEKLHYIVVRIVLSLPLWMLACPATWLDGGMEKTVNNGR